MEETFIERLSSEIDNEVVTLIGVATREIVIEAAQDVYKERRRRISSGLRRLGLEDPNEWPDLWLWYGYYKDTNLETYQSRRELILRRYQPLREALELIQERVLGTGITAPDTGWADVDRLVKKLRMQYTVAQTPEDHRAVGLLCRDVLIQLGRTVFDPADHVPEGAPVPLRSDPKARIEAAVAAEVDGASGHRLRQLVRATCGFVQEVVHAETDTDRKAGVAAEATIHLRNILHLLVPSPTSTVYKHDDGDEETDDTMSSEHGDVAYSEDERTDPADEEYYLSVLKDDYGAGRLAAE